MITREDLEMVDTYEAECLAALERFDREPCDVHRAIEEARWDDYQMAKTELGLCIEIGCRTISEQTFCAECFTAFESLRMRA